MCHFGLDPESNAINVLNAHNVFAFEWPMTSDQ